MGWLQRRAGAFWQLTIGNQGCEFLLRGLVQFAPVHGLDTELRVSSQS